MIDIITSPEYLLGIAIALPIVYIIAIGYIYPEYLPFYNLFHKEEKEC